MFLSVIIPTCDRLEFLEKCLKSVLNNQRINIGVDYEIIVSDDSLGDQSKNLIDEKFPEVTWLRGPRKGPASNRNFGAKYATAEWLIFTDDDCLPEMDWLVSYAEAIKQFKDQKVFEGWTNADRPQRRFDEEAPINTEGGLFWSCNFCIQKKFFFEIGAFDENFPFPAMEDSDLQRRILTHCNILFIENARVIHPWRRMIPFSTYKKRFASLVYFAKKWNEYNTFKYRISRIKILMSDWFRFTKELVHYSFMGWQFYLEKLWLNVLLILF